MNRGVLQSPPAVQQMMAPGSPNWWNINTIKPPLQQISPFLATPHNHLFSPFSSLPEPTTSSPSLPSVSFSSWNDDNQELPHQSWTQLLQGGLVGDEEKSCLNHVQRTKLGNWEEHLLQQASNGNSVVDVKQENSRNSYVYGHAHVEFHAPKPTWFPSPMVPVSSPNSCVPSLSTNKPDGRHPPPDLSSEWNSTATGGASKKAKIQPSSAQSTIKVRKERLGDRISALHQLVSPFGKTGTASVLLEAIGYIRFLHSQIEALGLPYLGSESGNRRKQHCVQGEKNCLFPEDPGQLLNENCVKRDGTSVQECHGEPKKDLKSRGLCLVPISCTVQVGSDNRADYCAQPAALGGGFR
uniref:Transcription factor bHLH10 n=1 Tax=Nothapodytes nimmoniana TaxID=159386 RepID=A0A9E9BYX5_NOTNI|nr:transcription factor bHLH10 [Nothapodytes nimmoniana]